MLKEERRYLQDLSREELLALAETLCHESPEVFPVYECVKVFVRLNEAEELTYARHRNDLGTTIVASDDIAARMKDPERRAVVFEALTSFEKAFAEVWPFSPGSNSWLQLEILHPTVRCKGPVNSPTIVVRKACRLSPSKTTATVTSSPLVERIFESFRAKCPEKAGDFKIAFAPSFRLKNIAGTGLISESSALLAGNTFPHTVAENIARALVEKNVHEFSGISPGFFVKVGGTEYRVVTSEYTSRAVRKEKPSRLPLPFAGWMK